MWEASVIRYRYCWRTSWPSRLCNFLHSIEKHFSTKPLIKLQKWFPSVRFLSSCFAFAMCILHRNLGITFWQEKNLGTKALIRIWNASDHWRGSSLKKRQTWTHIRRLPDVVFSTSNASSQSNALHTWGSDSFLTCSAGLCWDYSNKSQRNL